MILGIGSQIELWEQVAAVQVAQAVHADLNSLHIDPDLLAAASMPQAIVEPDFMLDFLSAYRRADDSATPYTDLLAGSSGFAVKTAAPRLVLPDAARECIVVCPYGLRKDLELPLQVWPMIIHNLKSYGFPVVFMAESGQRMEGAKLAEADILAECSLADKMRVLASAKLIVGGTNAYLWLATAWDKKQIIFYPDSVPISRWFSFESMSFVKLCYTRHDVRLPMLLAGLRSAI